MNKIFIGLLIGLVIIAIVVMVLVWKPVDEDLLAKAVGDSGTDFFECSFIKNTARNKLIGNCYTTIAHEDAICEFAGTTVPCGSTTIGAELYDQTLVKVFNEFVTGNFPNTDETKKYIITDTSTDKTISYQQALVVDSKWDRYTSLDNFNYDGINLTINGKKKGTMANRSRGFLVYTDYVEMRFYTNGQVAIVKNVTSDNTLVQRGSYDFKYGGTVIVQTEWNNYDYTIGTTGVDDSEDIYQLAWCPPYTCSKYSFDGSGSEFSMTYSSGETFSADFNVNGKFIVTSDGIPGISTTGNNTYTFGYWVPFGYQDTTENINLRNQNPDYVGKTGEVNYKYTSDFWIDPPTYHPHMYEYTAFFSSKQYNQVITNNSSKTIYHPYLIVGSDFKAVGQDVHKNAWTSIGDNIRYGGESTNGVSSLELSAGKQMNTVDNKWLFRMYEYGFNSMWEWTNYGLYPQQLTCRGIGFGYDNKLFDYIPVLRQGGHCNLAWYAHNAPSNSYLASLCRPTTWDTGALSIDGVDELVTLEDGTVTVPINENVPVMCLIETKADANGNQKPWMTRVAGKNSKTNGGYWQKAAGRYSSGVADVNGEEYWSPYYASPTRNAPTGFSPIGRMHSFQLTGRMQYSWGTASDAYTDSDASNVYAKYGEVAWPGSDSDWQNRSLHSSHVTLFPIWHY